MTKDAVRTRIREIGLIPSIRLSSAPDAVFAAEAISESGIPIVEVTMTVPGAVEVIHELAQNDPNLIVGAGSVFDLEVARRCLQAGAKFLTTPGLNRHIVEFALQENVVVFPGALTPTEITEAWQTGADFVKVFPCAQFGGAVYLKALRAPFPDVALIAAGGVNQQNAADFILAGAVALGIGRDLIQPDAIKRRERNWIGELSRRFLRITRDARTQLQTARSPG
jgi:2-dehydro-3-deoxyphosphogluconate aldolase/(4S)-4-hydroxy-2-oxoglutarate aldolase